MINELTKIYLNETRFKTRLSEEEAEKYFRCLLDKGNIYTATKGGQLVGYIEYFKITEEQVKRIISGRGFHIGEEDITSGDICFVQDVWIDKNYRGKEIWKELKNGLFERTKGCRLYIGEEQNTGKVKVRIHGKH